MLKFITLSFFISLFALAGCNKETNEVILTSTDKNQILNLDMVENKLIGHLKATPVKSKKIPQSITDYPLLERDGYLNSAWIKTLQSAQIVT